MELNQRMSSSIKNPLQKHVIGIPINSAADLAEKSPRGLLPDPASQSYVPPPSNGSPKSRQNRVDLVIDMMYKLGEKADNYVHGIRQHVRLGPKMTETVKGKLSLGAKILRVGGVEKIFKENFSARKEEKLLKASQCYLSTTAGPIAGLLFITTEKVAFISERSIRLSLPTGELLRAHYKVLIPLRKIKRANETENVKNPSRKYIEILTVDNFDFWFMGFISYQKTCTYLQQAISQVE